MTEGQAVGYVRLSQESDTSIEDQKEEIRELAAEHDMELVRIYDDGERSSGFDNTREEYLRMQSILEDEDVDHLIVRDRDRLSRDKRERSMLLYDLEEWGLELWTTVEGERVEIDDDEDWLMEMIRSYMADVQKRREIEKSKRKTEERVENGYWQGRPPFGLRLDEQNQYLEPKPETYDTARSIIERHESGESLRSIAGDDGVPVSRSTVRRVVENQERYLNAVHSP